LQHHLVGMSELSIFIPCVLNHLYPQTAERGVKIFKKLGYTVNIVENQACCGYPYLINGDKHGAKELAQKLLFDFQTGKRDHKILSLSPLCHHTIQNSYPNLFHNSISHNLCQKVLTDVADMYELIAAHEIVITPKEKSVLVIDNLSNLASLQRITNYHKAESNWLVKDSGYCCSGAGSGFNRFNNKLAKDTVLEYCSFAKEHQVDSLTFTDEFSLAFTESVLENAHIQLQTRHLFDILYEQLHSTSN